MKNALIIALFAISITINSAFAELQNTAAKERIQQKLENLKSDDFKSMVKTFNKRTPNEELSEFIQNNQSIKSKVQPNRTLEGSTNVVMPEKFNIPGEFEELQAVLITWPYYSFDASEEIQEPLEQLFEGKGMYYDDVTQSVKLIEIVSFPDVYPESPYSLLFLSLADAIQKEVPVWINIWQGSDSTAIKAFMSSNGKPLENYKFFVNPGNSFWYRDCGPVACYYGDNDDLGFIDFEYYGGRPLDDEIPLHVGNEMGFPVFTNAVEFEGGNILLDGDGSLFTTTSVSSLNADTEGKLYPDESSPYGFSVTEKIPLSDSQLNDSLAYYMNLDRIRIFPALENDGGTGHIDLYADLFDENTFVFTRMPSELSNFKDYKIASKNIDTLLSLKSRNDRPYLSRNIPFPRKDNGNWYSNRNDYAQYTRTYSNHILVNKTIVQPIFYNGTTGDKASHDIAIAQLKKAYPGYKIAEIDVRDFDGAGGAIHCITKQIPAENPLRIFHYQVQLADISETGFPVTAEITNKSGIESAKIYWRIKGSENWITADMTASGDNKYNGIIPNGTFTDSDVIEYYISATSNNGKTLTKPLTAPDGFYVINMPLVSVEEQQFTETTGEFFPNPANDLSSIELNFSGSSKVNISIVNFNGNEIYKNMVDIDGGYDILTLNTSLLASGSYIVSFKTEDGKVSTRKLNVVR